ncbi:hypothetical protein PIIN_10949 [Serendipita indica DSM 11827]|uniref:Uncharacterized protein n=1 Tax=Serendipita indica (strain DSM 11827) TaxID=1109443 RepID=G4U073_SERID|nr:hypothetical protein PIIN_10949 [Serendipita indica DSM 11827]
MKSQIHTDEAQQRVQGHLNIRAEYGTDPSKREGTYCYIVMLMMRSVL